MTDLRQAFLDGMSCVAATVNVVATDGPGGRSGVTVSAMSSVSADTEKPILLICVNAQGSGAASIIRNGVFTVNILRDDQSFVSDTFAGRYGDKGEARFGCASWENGVTGAPILKGALTSFDCRLIEGRIVGQHHVLFGEVQQVYLAERGRALIYANRSYSTALSLPPISDSDRSSDARRVCLACLSSFAPFYLPALLTRLRDKLPELRVDVLEGDQAQVARLVESGEAHFGLLYDRELPFTLDTTVLLTQHPYALFAADAPDIDDSEISLEALSARPLILLDQPLSRDYVCGLFVEAGVKPSIAMRHTSFEMVRSLVGRGMGFSLLVTRPAGDLTYDGNPLVVRQLAGDPAPISIALVQKSSTELGEVHREFVRSVIEKFAGEAGA